MAKLIDALLVLKRVLEAAHRTRQRQTRDAAAGESARTAAVYERDQGEPLPAEMELDISEWQPLSARSAQVRHPGTHGDRLATRIRARLREPDTLREALVLKEILDRPLAQRRRRGCAHR